MLTIKKQPFNSLWIKASSQDELGNTFIRFQEHYESSNPEFRNKIFTLGQLRHWYSLEYGADTYQFDWIGYNFPSRVLIPFKQGLFDPLTPQEENLLSLLKYRNDNFYIIGAQDNSVLRHELAHALYDYDKKYASIINSIIEKNTSKLKKVKNYILNKGYNKAVLNDELQAYITDNEDKYIMENTPKSVIEQINSTYKRFSNTDETH